MRSPANDFRRTAVRNLERASVPRSTAMRMVGHKTEAFYRRYAIVDEAMLREGAVKLEELHRSSSLSLLCSQGLDALAVKRLRRDEPDFEQFVNMSARAAALLTVKSVIDPTSAEV